MADHENVNLTRRFLSAAGGLLPAAYAATLVSSPNTAAAETKTQGGGKSADAANPGAATTSQALPPKGIDMHAGYAQAIARMAYVWGWPMVNMLNRNAGITQAPYPGLLNGVLPAAPRGQIAMLHDYIAPSQTFVTCPNQDVVYGLGFFSLDEEPVVMQVPEFGTRFWVYALYDARTNQFGRLGKPYRTRPGFYLLVGPNWKGRKPAGITEVVRASTALANAIPRVFMNDTEEDRKAIQPVIDQVVAYPLTQFDGKMKTIVWRDARTITPPGQANDKSADAGETKWVIPEKFFDQFGEVLNSVPPLPGEEALYAQFRSLMEVAGRNPDIKKAIVQAAVETERDAIDPFFQWRHNGVPAGNGWNRSTNNAQTGFDYFDRTGTSKSNMFDNRPDETQYVYTDVDAAGAPLTGDSHYEIVFAKGEEPPVNGFWSLTLYNDKHLFHPNDLKRYSLGTKNTTLKRNQDGSLTLYAGAKSPGAEKESNWLPAPSGKFSLYIRAYWGKLPILDGSWKPPRINRV
ncbi:signal peptide protein [Pandoraea captiosa]|uniref:Signal peptide protein n=2 Tax=Pandoraea captiosa TaxID=2508302 RepID=A0A5E4ZZ11_9BURK|nr:signal peptide protein [Pandoraea captiosa]